MQKFKPIMKTFAANLRMMPVMLLTLALFVVSPLRAQDPYSAPAEKPKEIPGYSLDIENGYLQVAGLTNSIDVNKLIPFSYGNGKEVPASLSNLIKVFRVLDTNANIVMDPALAEIQIRDVKFHSPSWRTDSLHRLSLNEPLQALAVASGNKFTVTMRGESLYVIEPTRFPMGGQSNKADDRTFEVFNLSNYLGRADEQTELNQVDELEKIITDTLHEVYPVSSHIAPESPDYKFHLGVKLLIVTGSNNAISVAKKIISALPMHQLTGAVDPNTGLPVAK
jgi:hypothetical protein